jgi:hypothetical protein
MGRCDNNQKVSGEMYTTLRVSKITKPYEWLRYSKKRIFVTIKWSIIRDIIEMSQNVPSTWEAS